MTQRWTILLIQKSGTVTQYRHDKDPSLYGTPAIFESMEDALAVNRDLHQRVMTAYPQVVELTDSTVNSDIWGR